MNVHEKEVNEMLARIDGERLSALMEDLTPFEYAMLRYLQEAANAKDDEEIVRITKEHSKKLIDFRP